VSVKRPFNPALWRLDDQRTEVVPAAGGAGLEAIRGEFPGVVCDILEMKLDLLKDLSQTEDLIERV
jgi:hypothetical protein